MTGVPNKSGGARPGAGAKKKIFVLNIRKPIMLEIEGRGKEKVTNLKISNSSLSFYYKGKPIKITQLNIYD